MSHFFKIAFFVLLSVFANIFAQDANSDFGGKQEDPDMEALRQWVRDKRLITVKELGGDLSISGEVRTEMQAIHEEKNGIQQRGRGGATNRANCAFDVEVNLMFDYRTERTWTAIKLEFDNDMGTVSGTTYKIALERAYLGGRLFAGETFILDGEIGRRNLNNVFDSKIEFSSIFDGILLKIGKAFESIGNFYINSGAFLVDDRKDHYGYISELGMLRLGNTGVYSKYSFISWKKNYHQEIKTRCFDFLISQLILGYQGEIPKWKKFLKVYLAGLLNHAAEKIDLTAKRKDDQTTKGRKENYGWYVGFSVGQVRSKGDWALDANYQVVAAQAIPDFDVGGIKRGNAADIGFYSEGRYGRGDPTTKETAVGSGNYKGWQAELLYAITNNLTLLQNFRISKNLRGGIGPKMRYYQYEIEFIYTF